METKRVVIRDVRNPEDGELLEAAEVLRNGLWTGRKCIRRKGSGKDLCGEGTAFG